MNTGASFLSSLLDEKAIDPINVAIKQDNAKPKADSTKYISSTEANRPCRWSISRKNSDSSLSQPLRPSGIVEGTKPQRVSSDPSLLRMPLRMPSRCLSPTELLKGSTRKIQDNSKNASWENIDLLQAAKKQNKGKLFAHLLDTPKVDQRKTAVAIDTEESPTGVVDMGLLGSSNTRWQSISSNSDRLKSMIIEPPMNPPRRRVTKDER